MFNHSRWGEFLENVMDEATSQLIDCASIIAAAERWDYDVGEFNSARPAVKSFDGKIECKDVGANAADYDWWGDLGLYATET